MKPFEKLTIYILAVLVLSSCAASYTQIVDVASTNLQKEGNNYTYNDGVCKVTYNFWESNGNAGFIVENLSESAIYIDLDKCFFVSNGYANDYFKNRIHSESTTHRVSESINAIGLLGFGSSLGYTVKASNSQGKGVSIQEKQIITIPAHTKKIISEYYILDDILQDCSVDMFPTSSKSQPMATFSSSDSPVKFSNIINYSKSSEGNYKEIKHDFYISSFHNYTTEKTKVEEKYGCGGKQTKWYNQYSNPSRFYIIYNNKHKNTFSKDAKRSLMTY